MKSTQWYLIGIFLIIMSFWFIRMDMTWSLSCNVFDDSAPLNKADIVACVNGEILDPFIWLLFSLGGVFIICGWIESYSKKREEKEKYRKSLLEGKDKDFVMKVSQKLKLKHLPQDIPELVYWGKKENKEKEIDKEIDKYMKERIKGLKRIWD